MAVSIFVSDGILENGYSIVQFKVSEESIGIWLWISEFTTVALGL